jgi:hypothetical protein
VRTVWLCLLSAGALVAGGGIEPVLGWSKMVWQSMNFGAFTVPHAALMIDARVDGLAAPALMQLDTGVVNLVHRVPKDTGLQRTTWRGHEFGINGTAAGRQFHDEWFGVRKDDLPMVEGKPVIGTMGASFFERRILILDFGFVARRHSEHRTGNTRRSGTGRGTPSSRLSRIAMRGSS